MKESPRKKVLWSAFIQVRAMPLVNCSIETCVSRGVENAKSERWSERVVFEGKRQRSLEYD